MCALFEGSTPGGGLDAAGARTDLRSIDQLLTEHPHGATAGSVLLPDDGEHWAPRGGADRGTAHDRVGPVVVDHGMGHNFMGRVVDHAVMAGDVNGSLSPPVLATADAADSRRPDSPRRQDTFRDESCMGHNYMDVGQDAFRDGLEQVTFHDETQHSEAKSRLLAPQSGAGTPIPAHGVNGRPSPTSLRSTAL